jgi:hypothetical protein
MVRRSLYIPTDKVSVLLSSRIIRWLLLFYVIGCVILTHRVDAATVSPTHRPTGAPVTYRPTKTHAPIAPTARPTTSPTIGPSTWKPTILPTSTPPGAPSATPSGQPSRQPTRKPSGQPSSHPSTEPTSNRHKPTSHPTGYPSGQPSTQPTNRPTSPTPKPTNPTAKPTRQPSRKPSTEPTAIPSAVPSISFAPTVAPTVKPTPRPTAKPTVRPTSIPTIRPTYKPTAKPTARPTTPTGQPTSMPSAQPSTRPTTLYPTSRPTKAPHSSQPTVTYYPTGQPSGQPSTEPSSQPTGHPTSSPSLSKTPTKHPTGQPTSQPSTHPSSQPSARPSSKPTVRPTGPTGQPTSQPTRKPSTQPTRQPTGQPSSRPSGQPTGSPTGEPTMPSGQPTSKPTTFTRPPTGQPSGQPTGIPSGQPSRAPTSAPTKTNYPSSFPTYLPSGQPSASPSTLVQTDRPTGKYQYANASGTVTYDPKTLQLCEALEITMVIYSYETVTVGDAIKIMTPGLTAGPCTSNVDGSNVTPLILWNATLLNGTFYEGKHTNNYLDSYILLSVRVPVGFEYDFFYTVIIDRGNELKLSTTMNTSRWDVSMGRCSYANCTDWRYTGYLVVHDLELPHLSPIYYGSMQLNPAYQRVPASFNFTFSISFDPTQGDYIKVWMPGFSNRYRHYHRNQTDEILYGGSVKYLDNSTVLTNASFGVVAIWHEGTHSLNYDDSYLILSPTDVTSFAKVSDFYLQRIFWVTIDAYPNFISPQCGRPPNYKGYKFVIENKYKGTNLQYSNETLFDFVTPIGPGCADFNFCNGHGSCDYCSDKCYCDDGFGSVRDLALAVSNDFQPDCSSYVCPTGISSASVYHTYYDGTHRPMECSANGVCDRSTGSCKCYNGFTGAACEILNTCGPGMTCSGKGQCYSMRQLAENPAALPLSNQTYSYQAFNKNATIAWDGNSIYGCVCDSSWPVGLGANETQQAEYFGAQCEFRHCPSGDNPSTKFVVETDCYNKAAIPNGQVGQVGNLCHVDCSNQGKCDFSTGTCSCFKGWQGSNCGTRVAYMN